MLLSKTHTITHSIEGVPYIIESYYKKPAGKVHLTNKEHMTSVIVGEVFKRIINYKESIDTTKFFTAEEGLVGIIDCMPSIKDSIKCGFENGEPILRPLNITGFLLLRIHDLTYDNNRPE